MNDLTQRFVGAAVLATGLWSATLVGTSIATAETEPGPDKATSSQSTEPPDRANAGDSPKASERQPNSPNVGGRDDANDSAGSTSSDPSADAPDHEGISTDGPPESGESDAPPAPDASVPGPPTDAEPELVDPLAPSTSPEVVEVGADAAKNDGAPAVRDLDALPQADVDPGNEAATDAEPVATEPRPESTSEPSAGAAIEPAPDDADAPATFAAAEAVAEDVPSAAVMAAAAVAVVEPATPPAGPTLTNVIGSLFFAVFDFFNRLIEGPPVVPAGSNLRVGRSTLEIDCGDGYTADADWYFPTSGQPDKLIYFQHGFGARAGFYNITAAELAERNNAIVVAPSITGNFFACDGCSLDGDQMHAAVAKLFLGDPGTGERTALAASAAAAGFEGTMPEEFVISGHSAGGQLAAGAGGYFADYATPETGGDLLGVLLFDTSATGGALERALTKLDGVPVLHIAGAPAPLNTYGNANQVLEAARPGQFNGVQLVGGTHSDAFRSSAVFGLAQVIVSLATGASTPENVEAVQVLAQGWITDWFEGTHTDAFYGAPGTTIPVETNAGTAHARVLPVPPAQLTFFDQIANTFLNSLQYLTTKPCAVDPDDTFGEYTGDSTQKFTPDTALSLDERRQTGQSVGQHGCTS